MSRFNLSNIEAEEREEPGYNRELAELTDIIERLEAAWDILEPEFMRIMREGYGGFEFAKTMEDVTAARTKVQIARHFAGLLASLKEKQTRLLEEQNG